MSSQTDTSSTMADHPNLEKGSEDQITTYPNSEGIAKAEEMQEPPEGGTKAYLCILGAALGMFVSFGWVNCIALFQAEYQTNQLKQYTSSEVSWIPSMEIFVMLFICPLSGRLFDNFGPRLPIAIGTFLHVFGLMMASLAKEYYQFMLSQSVCSSIGASLIFTSAMTSPMTYFKKNRALAGGLSVAGSSLGGVIFPIMAQHLIPRIGYPWTMRACAFFILGLLVITNLTISSNLEHIRKPLKLTEYLRPLQETNFVIMCISSFVLYWGMFVPINYLSTSAIYYGMSTTMAINLIPIFNGLSFFGRTVPNIIADRYGRFNMMLIMVAFSTIMVFALWLPGRSNAAIITFAAFFGIGTGACIGLAPALIMAMSPVKEVGLRIGIIMAFAGVGALTGPPIAGNIKAQHGGSYVYACVFSGVSYFASLVGLIILRGRMGGWKLTTKI